jgi:hypothetical protein
MDNSNQQVTSREYNIMLKPTAYADLKKGLATLLDTDESQVDSDLPLKKNIEVKKSRRTWYLDTDSYIFNSNIFLFRIRKEVTKLLDVTLKYRHPDRYFSAPHDLTSRIKDLEIKFEEDITTPFTSKFSLSASFIEN